MPYPFHAVPEKLPGQRPSRPTRLTPCRRIPANSRGHFDGDGSLPAAVGEGS